MDLYPISFILDTHFRKIKEGISVSPGSGLGVIEADVIVVSVVETDSDVVPADIIVESGVLVLNGVTKRKFINENLPLKFLTPIYNEPRILILGKKYRLVTTTKYRSLSFILYPISFIILDTHFRKIKDRSSVLPGSGLGVIEADVTVVSVVETESDVVSADIIVESGVLVLNGVTKRKLISENLQLKFLTPITNQRF